MSEIVKRTCTVARLLLGCAAMAAGHQALAQSHVSFDSSVFVERQDGTARRLLEPARQLSPGDRVVYVMRWERPTGQGGFTVTNPLPRAVYYQASATQDEDVSVDGGRTWGKIGALRIGTRFATPEDVTHVRWHVPANQAARREGRIAYSAIVR